MSKATSSIKNATRPFFAASKRKEGQLFIEENVSFDWHSGMSWRVRQRSSDAMADAIISKYGHGPQGIQREEILEVSTASHNYETGQALSAINLAYTSSDTGETHSVEGWFQAAKVFSCNGRKAGPYPELLCCKTPKRYLNQKLDKKTRDQYANDELFQSIQADIEGATLYEFQFEGESFPLIPRSGFYDYLYIKALNQPQNEQLAESLMRYRVFTDIMFTPGAGKTRKYNTQARSCAIYVALKRRGIVSESIRSFNAFVNAIGYENNSQQLF